MGIKWGSDKGNFWEHSFFFFHFFFQFSNIKIDFGQIYLSILGKWN